MIREIHHNTVMSMLKESTYRKIGNPYMVDVYSLDLVVSAKLRIGRKIIAS